MASAWAIIDYLLIVDIRHLNLSSTSRQCAAPSPSKAGPSPKATWRPSSEHRQRGRSTFPTRWRFMGPHRLIVTGKAMHNSVDALLPYVPELLQRQISCLDQQMALASLAIVGVALFAIGGWPFVLWGHLSSTVIGLHSTWLVNSATHMWGSRRFCTGDTSTNSFWSPCLPSVRLAQQSPRLTVSASVMGSHGTSSISIGTEFDVTNHGPRQRH